MSNTILVVDDDILITNSLKMLLNAALKYNVITCNDPLEALNIFKTNKDIDLVLSDFMMPNIDGITLLKEIRSINKNTITILLTGYSDKDSAIKAINEIGIYYYLEKPWDNSNLIKILQNGLEKKRLESELCTKLEQLENSQKEIQHLYILLEEEHNKTLAQNETLERIVREKTRSMQSLMDNAGQGFLYFGLDLLIRPEFSSECINILGERIEGKNFANYLFPEDSKEKELFIYALHEMLGETKEDLFDLQTLYIPLLPDEVIIRDKVIHIDYKPITDYRNQKLMMVVFTDISKNKILEDEIKKDRNQLAMIVSAVINKRELLDSIRDYIAYCSSLEKLIYEEYSCTQKRITSIYRTFHNFKGTFAQLQLVNAPKQLHHMESELFKLKDCGQQLSKEYIRDYLKHKDPLKFIEEDINTLKQILGDDYFLNGGSVQISSKDLERMKNRILLAVQPSKYPLVYNEFAELEMCSLHDMLKSMCNYTVGLASQLGKCIEPFDVKGPDIMIDCLHYRQFVKSLVNIFRNMVYHGIECPDVRLEAGKSEVGVVACRVDSLENGEILIEISDDGKGIDIDKLRKIAIDKGFALDEEIDWWSDDEVVEIIFADGVSVCETANLIAGRGEGMSEVKHQVEKLGGRIETTTIRGKGTTFTFVVPELGKSILGEVDSKDIMNAVQDTIMEVLGDLSIGLNDKKVTYANESFIALSQYNCLMEIRGIFSGFVGFSVESSLGNRLSEYFIGEVFENPVNHPVIFDCVQEFTNIVLGRSFSKVKYGDQLIIDDSIGVFSESLTFRYCSNNAIKQQYDTEYGLLQVSVLKKGF